MLVLAALAAMLVLPAVAPAATFTVTTVDDAGPGSLRQAIVDANAAAGADTIAFAIAGVGTQSIKPLSELPAVTDAVVIDGETQPGFTDCTSPHPIELDGSLAGFANGLVIARGPSVVRGLAINGFAGFDRAAIRLVGNGDAAAGGNHVYCNFIGTDATGTAAKPNAHGVEINSADNVIGGTTPAERNVISGNGDGGVHIEDNGVGQVTNLATRNVISGNYIGTDVTGTLAIGNRFGGVWVNGPRGQTIGGTVGVTPGGACTGACNLISGNDLGIDLGGGFVGGGNVVAGNYIGTTVSGLAPLGNTTGVGAFSVDNRVGGSSSAERNVISGNANFGIQIGSNGWTGNVVQGNYVGADARGIGAVGNGIYGILATGARDTLIGGPGAGNVISGNGNTGVVIEQSSSRVTVQGNLVGTQRDGVSPLPNRRDGVLVWAGATGASASDNTIGGTAAGAGNTIAFNGLVGVQVEYRADLVGAVRDNAIEGNSIHSNGGLGIDLGGDGPTLNDPGDADSGANDLQNYPVLTNVSGGSVGGTLNSTANTLFRVEVFASTSCDPSGYGEGDRLLGAASVTTDDSGNASFAISAATSAGEAVTATATDPTGNTSEFSKCFALPARVPAAVSLEPKAGSDMVGSQHCVTATVTDASGAAFAGVTVRFSVAGANSASGEGRTDESGRAQYCYIGVNAGVDTITASAGAASDTASEVWTPRLPTTADQCKNDGWKAFGVFKNQGDCVSYLATNGKNLPVGQ